MRLHCSAGVNVPSVRMVDASEGVLGLQWINGKSIRILLGGGAEGEEETEYITGEEDVPDEPIEEEDPLLEFRISKGKFLCSVAPNAVLIGPRGNYAEDWHGNCEDAPS